MPDKAATKYTCLCPVWNVGPVSQKPQGRCTFTATVQADDKAVPIDSVAKNCDEKSSATLTLKVVREQDSCDIEACSQTGVTSEPCPTGLVKPEHDGHCDFDLDGKKYATRYEVKYAERAPSTDWKPIMVFALGAVAIFSVVVFVMTWRKEKKSQI